MQEILALSLLVLALAFVAKKYVFKKKTKVKSAEKCGPDCTCH